MTLQTDLQAAVNKATAASQVLHDIVHGNAVSSVVTDNGPVKTAAKAITDVEASIQTHMGELTAKVNSAAASETAAATSETKASLWAEQPENTTVAPGAYSALHHAAKADASRIKAGQWAETPEDQAVEPGLFSARHWAAKAQVFAQGKPEFHAIAVTATGNLIWTHGVTGTFSPDDYAAWWLVPQGASLSINQQGHMEVTI